MNLFAEAARNATSIKTPSLYGGVEVRESEYHMAYAECLNLAYGMTEKINLHAESMTPLIEKLGLMGAFLYGEAEGGFFKRILDALIKLFEKIKGFFGALLGRFKSNKSYREDLSILKAVFKNDKYNYTDKAVLKIPKHRWEALAAIVNNVLKKDSIVFSQKYDGSSIGDVVNGAKELMTMIEKANMKEIDGKTATSKINGTLQYLQSKYHTVDTWVKFIMETAIGNAKTGDANFGVNSSQTATEAISKLWDNATEEIKGNDIAKAVGDFYQSMIKAIDSLSVDNILPALEEGEAFFKEKAEELKTNLNDLGRISKRVSENESSGAAVKRVAQEASNTATTYSTVITNYSTMTITSFNNAKGIFDKLLSEGKKVSDALDKVRKDAGNME